MDYIIGSWNNISDEAKEIVMLCTIVQVVAGAIMIKILSVLDRREKWQTEEPEDWENPETG